MMTGCGLVLRKERPGLCAGLLPRPGIVQLRFWPGTRGKGTRSFLPCSCSILTVNSDASHVIDDSDMLGGWPLSHVSLLLARFSDAYADAF